MACSYVWQPNLGKLQKDGGTVLIFLGNISPKKALSRRILAVVRTEFAGQYPEVVKRYIAVLDEAVKDIPERSRKRNRKL
jgi:taurine transport system substrate-binding protein